MLFCSFLKTILIAVLLLASPRLHLATVLINPFSEVELYCNTFLTVDFNFIRDKDALGISTVVLAAFPVAGPTSTTQLSKPCKTPDNPQKKEAVSENGVNACLEVLSFTWQECKCTL